VDPSLQVPQMFLKEDAQTKQQETSWGFQPWYKIVFSKILQGGEVMPLREKQLFLLTLYIKQLHCIFLSYQQLPVEQHLSMVFLSDVIWI
jgi:hypothetical protein